MSKIKATAYLRYSDKKQDGNHSLDIQKTQIKLLEERENLEIIAWREDKATSAFHKNFSKRKGIHLIMEDLENGAQAICFYEESRLTRSITDLYFEFYLPIKQAYPNVKFFNAQSIGEWNPDDPMAQIKLWGAKTESAVKSTRAKDAQLNLLGKQQRPGSRIPVGYDMVDGMLYPNEDSPIVEFIYFLASFGYSHQLIADYLNRCGIKTKFRSNDKEQNNHNCTQIITWNSSTIGYILSNRVYSGDIAWNVRTDYDRSKPKPEVEIDFVKNTHEPLIAPTQLHLVKQINDLKTQYGTMCTPYFLRGIVKCKTCGSLLMAKDQSPKGKKGQYMIYRCTCCKKNVSIFPIHDAILQDLQRKWNNQLSVIADSVKSHLKAMYAKLQRVKEKVQEELDRTYYNERMLTAEIEGNPSLAEAIRNAQIHLQEEVQYISTTQEEIQRLLDDDSLIVFTRELIDQSFHDFSHTELRVLLLMFFEEVTIDFEKNNDLEINYRISPFVSLETTTGYLTENFL